MADDATLRIGGNVDGLLSALTRGGAGFGSLFAAIAGGAAVGSLVADGITKIAGAVASAVMSAAKLGDELLVLSHKTGISVESLSALKFTTTQTDVSLESMTNAMFKMGVNIAKGGQDVSKALNSIGLSLAGVRNMHPEDAFAAILAGLDKIPNHAQQSLAGMQIFGKGFKDVASLTKEDMAGMMKQAQALGLVMSTETAKAADRFNDSMKAIHGVMSAIVMKIGAAVLPTFARLAESLLKNIQTTNSLDTVLHAIGVVLGFLARAVGYPIAGLFALWGALANLGGMVDSLAIKFLNGVKTILQFQSHIPGMGAASAAAIRAVDRAIAFFNKDLAETKVHYDNAQRRGQAVADVTGELATAFDNLGTKAAPTAAAGVKQVAGAFEESGTKSSELQTKLTDLNDKLLQAARAGTSPRDVLAQFGAEAAKAATEATMLGVTVPAAVQKIAAAFNSAALRSAMIALEGQITTTIGTVIDMAGRAVEVDGYVLASTLNNLKIATDAKLAAARAAEQFTLDEFSFRKNEVDRWVATEKAAVKTDGANKAAAFAAIEAAAAGMYKQIDQEAALSWQNQATQVVKWGDIVKSTLASIPQLLQAAFTGGGGLSGALKAMLSNLGSGIGGKLFTDLGTKIGPSITKMFGETFGGAINAALPGIGSAIGALVGPLMSKIVGLFSHPKWKDAMKRVGSEWGVSISEQLAKKIEATMKSQGIGRVEASLLHMKDIIAEAGGITDKNFTQLIGKLHDVFSMVETGKFSVTQARGVLDQNFQVFADHIAKSGQAGNAALRQIIDLNTRFKTESVAIRAYLEGQTADLGTGVAAMLAPIALQYQGLAAKIAAARTTLAGAKTDASTLTAAAALNKLLAQQAVGAKNSATEIDNLANIAVAGFNKAVADGAAFDVALKNIGPSLQTLSQLQKDLGITNHNAAVQDLIDLQARVTKYPQLVQAATGYNQVITASANLGTLNASNIASFGAQAVAQYTRMQAAGFKQNEILRMMGPGLKTLVQQYQALGVPIDAATQKILDAAKAEGVLGKAGEDTNSILKEGLGALITALGGALPAAWKRAAAAGTAAGVVMTRSVDGVTHGQSPGGVDGLIATLSGPLLGAWNTAARASVTAGGQIVAAVQTTTDRAAAFAKALVGIPFAQTATTGTAAFVQVQGAMFATAVAGKAIDTQLNSVNFASFAQRGVNAAKAVEYAMNKVAFGSSPTGLAGVRQEVRGAMNDFREFERVGVLSMGHLHDAVTSVGGGLFDTIQRAFHLSAKDATAYIRAHLDHIDEMQRVLKAQGFTVTQDWLQGIAGGRGHDGVVTPPILSRGPDATPVVGGGRGHADGTRGAARGGIGDGTAAAGGGCCQGVTINIDAKGAYLGNEMSQRHLAESMIAAVKRGGILKSDFQGLSGR